MDAALSPPDIRAAALAVIGRQLNAEPILSTRLAEYSTLTTVQLLLALEDEFGIGLDPDEVLPHGTVAHLLILVQRRVLLGPVRPYGGGAQLYDFTALHAERRGGPLALLLAAADGAEVGRWPATPETQPGLAAYVGGRLEVLPLPDRACHARRPVQRALAWCITAAAMVAGLWVLFAAVGWFLANLGRTSVGA